MVGELSGVASFIVLRLVEMRGVECWLGSKGKLAGGRTVLATVDRRFHVGHVRGNRWDWDIVHGLHRVHSHVTARLGGIVIVMMNVRATSRSHPLGHAIRRVSRLGARERG